MRRGAYLDVVLISRLALELAHRLVPLGLWRRRRRGGRRVSTRRESRRFVKGAQHSQSPRSAPADAAATAQGRRPRARGSLRACETARSALGSGQAQHRPGCCTVIGCRPSAARRRHHREHSRPRGPRAGTRRGVRPASAAEARARPARARTCCWRHVGRGFLAYLAAAVAGGLAARRGVRMQCFSGCGIRLGGRRGDVTWGRGGGRRSPLTFCRVVLWSRGSRVACRRFTRCVNSVSPKKPI